MKTEGIKHCRICGNRLFENGYDLLILEICWNCIPEYTPMRLISESVEPLTLQEF